MDTLFIKKLGVTLGAILILAGCTSNTDALQGTTTLETSDYSIVVPATWNEIAVGSIETSIDPDSFLVYRAPSARNGVYSKFSITKEKLLIATTQEEYAEHNIEKAPFVVPVYTELQQTPIIVNGAGTKAHIFTAKSSDDDPVQLYIQSYVLIDRYTGYTLTFSLPKETTSAEYDKYIKLIETFKTPRA